MLSGRTTIPLSQVRPEDWELCLAEIVTACKPTLKYCPEFYPFRDRIAWLDTSNAKPPAKGETVRKHPKGFDSRDDCKYRLVVRTHESSSVECILKDVPSSISTTDLLLSTDGDWMVLTQNIYRRFEHPSGSSRCLVEYHEVDPHRETLIPGRLGYILGHTVTKDTILGSDSKPLPSLSGPVPAMFPWERKQSVYPIGYLAWLGLHEMYVEFSKKRQELLDAVVSRRDALGMGLAKIV